MHRHTCGGSGGAEQRAEKRLVTEAELASLRAQLRQAREAEEQVEALRRQIATQGSLLQASREHLQQVCALA